MKFASEQFAQKGSYAVNALGGIVRFKCRSRCVQTTKMMATIGTEDGKIPKERPAHDKDAGDGRI